jgi:hypothetical protein
LLPCAFVDHICEDGDVVNFGLAHDFELGLDFADGLRLEDYSGT